MKRGDGLFWIKLAHRNGGYLPALLLDGEWFLIGCCEPIPESELIVGPRLHEMPPADLSEYKRTVGYAGHA